MLQVIPGRIGRGLAACGTEGFRDILSSEGILFGICKELLQINMKKADVSTDKWTKLK